MTMLDFLRREKYTAEQIGVTLQDRAFVVSVAVDALTTDPAWKGTGLEGRRQAATRMLFARYLVRSQRIGQGDDVRTVRP